MKCFVSFVASSVVFPVILTVVGSGPQHHRTTGECGLPVGGIALCLSASAETGAGTLEVRNAGPNDVVLNLGVMLANGMRQYATAITLLLTDAEHEQRHF